MAKISFGTFLGLLLVAGIVQGFPMMEEKRGVSKDNSVREMYELLHARRKAELDSKLEIAPPTTTSPIVVDSYQGESNGGSPLTQLCTDAVTFLSSGTSDHEKRNLVINHVYNICIRPGADLDVDELMKVIRGNAKGDKFATTTRNPPTTEDPWQKILDDIFDVDIEGQGGDDDVTTEPPSFASTVESLDDLLEEFIDLLEEEEEGEFGEVPTTPRTTPSSESEDLDAFLELLEEIEEADKAQGHFTVPTNQPPRTTAGVKTTTEDDMDAVLDEFMHMMEELEEEDDEGAPTPTPQTTAAAKPTTEVDFEAALNDFWDMVDKQEEEQATPSPTPPEKEQLPPIDISKKAEMKKRLLKMLAKNLAEKRAMRK